MRESPDLPSGEHTPIQEGPRSLLSSEFLLFSVLAWHAAFVLASAQSHEVIARCSHDSYMYACGLAAAQSVYRQCGTCNACLV